MKKLTYQELLNVLNDMTTEQLQKGVELRDYANQETHTYLDFISNGENYQIGFNQF